MSGKLNYGNWIRKKILWGLGLSTLVMGLIAFLPLPIWLRLVAGILCIVLAISFLYPLYAYIMFSPQGGNLQEKLYNLLTQSLEKPITGQILDIGAGNGILAIKLAQAFPFAKIIGLDYWGRNWEYAQSVCEANARIAAVAEQVQFVRGDAARVDFPAAKFDAVISNLTFHEVDSVADKNAVVKEALRVLKPGGRFAFIDYFYESRHYGQPAKIENMLRSIGISDFTLQPLSQVLEIPVLLQHPKALGKAGILFGKK